MITDIAQKLIVLMVGLVFLVSAVRILLRSKNVNHAERVQIIKAAEYLDAWILLVCFVVTLVFGVVTHFEMKKTVHAVVALNYSEASQALNSNGTRYNMSEIISDEVVESAIKKGALENAKSLNEKMTGSVSRELPKPTIDSADVAKNSEKQTLPKEFSQNGEEKD